MKTNTYVQWVRGICILMVILIHCKSGMGYDLNTFEYNYGIILRQFINFPVAVFVFFSGYYTKLDDIHDRSRLIARIIRLGIPYLVWSIIYIAYRMIVAHEIFSFYQIICLIVNGTASGQLYFIMVMMQCTLLTPLIKKFMQCKFGNIILLSITPLYYIIVYMIYYITNIDIPYRATLFPAWFVYFYLGIYIKNKCIICSICKNNKKCFIYMYLLGIFLSILEAWIIVKTKSDYSFAVTQVKFSSMICSFAVIGYITGKIDSKLISNNNILKKLGDISYGVFYVHLIWLNIVTIFMNRLNLFDLFLPIYQCIQLVCTILLSYVSIIVMKRVVGKKLARILLGF